MVNKVFTTVSEVPVQFNRKMIIVEFEELFGQTLCHPYYLFM